MAVRCGRPEDAGHRLRSTLQYPPWATSSHAVAGGQRGAGRMSARIRRRAIARYYTTVVQGMSVQARDGASRADIETVITCAMATWDVPAPAQQAS
jgi:hypothetical protein